MTSAFDDGLTDLFWLEQAPDSWAANLAQALSNDPSGRLLRGICSHRLNTSQLRMVGAAIAGAAAASADFDALRSVRVGIVGAGTLDFLADAIPGTAPRFGLRIEVAPTQFNSIATAGFVTPDFGGPVDVVVILPDSTAMRLPAALLDSQVHEDAMKEALAVLERVADALRAEYRCAVVVATVPPQIDASASASDRAVIGSVGRFIADVNAGIVDLAMEKSFVLWDLALIAGSIGYRRWRDPVAMYVAKSPFSIGLAPVVADRLCALLAGMFGKSRRALVLDLDNTIWGGVIGDDGLDGISVAQGDATGEAHLAVQHYALELRRRGIVLAVCSKNDDSVARSPFREHPDMLLREEHIAVFQANWSDKATNIKTIADSLALNLDALVFLDDNPAERTRVRTMFPEVAVPELPDDPALFVSCLSAGGYFETPGLGADDLTRASAYQDNARRAEIRQSVGDYDEYLRSLDMRLTVSPFDKIGRSRIVQLINKSNQFNLTSRRRQDADVAAIETASDHVGLQFRLVDCFGDNGMISVVVLRLEAKTMVIDTWLMSCRVLERGVEQAVLNEIVAVARTEGIEQIFGDYIPTPRNAMVREHYKKIGFTALGELHDCQDLQRFVLEVAAFNSIPVQMIVDRAS